LWFYFKRKNWIRRYWHCQTRFEYMVKLLINPALTHKGSFTLQWQRFKVFKHANWKRITFIWLQSSWCVPLCYHVHLLKFVRNHSIKLKWYQSIIHPGYFLLELANSKDRIYMCKKIIETYSSVLWVTYLYSWKDIWNWVLGDQHYLTTQYRLIVVFS
jgi:hypothetical protein